jgi:Cu(I)/Ag(I) efflux system membrane protein CusA/SilA
VRGKIPPEDRNRLNRFLIFCYRPFIHFVLRRPVMVLLAALAILLVSIHPLSRLGGEFLPRMDEGDLLYMPSTLPGISIAEAGRILQITDKLIMTVPEVEQVFGKAGRAETATDPAPIEMLETTIRLKPRERWREGMTTERIIEELDRTVRLPGVANFWVPPIRARIDMVSTGAKSPIAVRVSGKDMAAVDKAAVEVQNAARKVDGVTSALAESLTGGRYIDVTIRRGQAARYGMNVAQVQAYVSSAVGGENVTETVEGVARYPVNIRYPQSYRDSLDDLRNLPMLTPLGQQITLGDVADLQMHAGPSMLKSEQARPAGWVYVDARNRSMTEVVEDIARHVAEIHLPEGVSIAFTGQYELLDRAMQRLRMVVPATLAIIFLLLYLEFRSVGEALLIMCCLPFACIGGVWFMYLQGYSLSVASGVGFIALAGLAAEFGVVMLLYLKQAVAQDARLAAPETATEEILDEAIYHGAVLRVRPKAMTVITTVAGLLPIFWREGTGSEIMTRIAAPMFGGMVSAALLSMVLVPAAYKLLLAMRLRISSRRSAPMPVPR